MTELFEESATAIVKKLKSGQLSIQESLDAMQARIAAVDTSVNSLPTVCFDRASESATVLQNKPVEERGKLCGLPVTIKDLTDVKGVRSTMGSAVFKDRVPESSNQLVSRIETHGGVVYAKSNSPEFGAGGITFNDVFGITRSPYDLSMSSGGSSGGAAASLAAGCAWLSHGSDMAGSLRTPASFCGVTSLRPSPGTIRSDSLYLPFDVLGADGPMARNITDLALFADVMRNENTNAMQDALASNKDTKLQQLKIAVSRDLGVTTVADDVADLFERFVDEHLTNCKSLIRSEPDLTGVHSSFDALRANFYSTALEPIFEENRDVIKPEVVWNVEQGLALTSAQYRTALRAQGTIINTAARFMRDADVLICPATSLTSVSAEARYPGDNDDVPMPEYYRWLAIAYASTMTTLPVITVPVGKTVTGLPFGVQLIGKPWGEANLFQAALQIEQMIGGSDKPIDPS